MLPKVDRGICFMKYLNQALIAISLYLTMIVLNSAHSLSHNKQDVELTNKITVKP